ncbi:hypothetical protein CANDROIZ_340002 [Candidatus Roizmanbacteria bacterium]|nr:hypothetical protein CANDROIZ_340002 [Candidatus Roizmanbacteria bacterium]
MSNYGNYSKTPLEDKIMEEVIANEKTKENKRYSPLLTANDILSLADIEESWLVKNIVLLQGITIISGLPNHFKSLFTQLLIKAVASGVSFLGQFETQQGAVLVIDREIPTQRLKRRLKSIEGFTGLPIFFYPYSDPFKLDNKEDAEYLKRIVKENNIKLVVVDTFNRSHSGKEINSSGEVGQIFEPLKAILEQTAIILIHHSNKSGYAKEIPTPDELLGSVDFGAQTDLLFTLRKKDKNTVAVYNLKARDSELLNPFQLTFTSYDHGLVDLAYDCEINLEETAVEARERTILGFFKSGKKKKSQLMEHLKQFEYAEGTINNTLTVLKNKNLLGSVIIEKEAYYFLLETQREQETPFPIPNTQPLGNQEATQNSLL